jgi:hypothetical protein
VLYLEKILLKELLDVRRMMLKEIMREIEIEIKKKGQKSPVRVPQQHRSSKPSR